MKKILKVTTGNPGQLRDDINGKIQSNDIRTWEYDGSMNTISHVGNQYKGHFRTWEYDGSMNTISHVGNQYKGHFHFEYDIDKNKGILEFILHSYGSAFAESKAVPLLERMLTEHFGDRIEFIR